jgi:hypothetical protein
MPLNLLILLLIAVAPIRRESSPHCYRVDVDTVVVWGAYVPELHYGAPGFGENPRTDARVRVPMLRLSRPLEVCPTSAVAGSPSSKVYRFTKVQLALPGNGWPPKDSVSRVYVSGLLVGRSAPGEFTSVVIIARHVRGLPGITDGP